MKLDIENLLESTQSFFQTNQTLSIDFRIEQLQKLKKGIIEYEGEILEALQKDLGKSSMEAFVTEIGFTLNSINHTIKHVKKWAKSKKVSTPISLFPAKSEIRYEPYGTVLIIGPFNYPFQLVIEPLVGAIAAGNCVVIKPSELVPHVSSVITKMIASIFPSTYICSIEGGVEVNKRLSQAKFDYIFFTGSTNVGKLVMKEAAENLVPVTLELGGKSPTIVDESANISMAAKRIIWGKTMNVGQTCVAPDYVVVHASVKDKLVEEMKYALSSFYGDKIKESQDYGRIVNDSHFNRLISLVEQERASILTGGRSDKTIRFMEPTLIEATWDSPTMGEEIFGPLLPIISFVDVNKVIQEIQKHEKPLALYIFTEKKEVANHLMREITSGGVTINDTLMHLSNPALPFGGVGASGIGAYHGKYSFLTFSHARSILKRGTKIQISAMYPPYSSKKEGLLRKLWK